MAEVVRSGAGGLRCRLLLCAVSVVPPTLLNATALKGLARTFCFVRCWTCLAKAYRWESLQTGTKEAFLGL